MARSWPCCSSGAMSCRRTPPSACRIFRTARRCSSRSPANTASSAWATRKTRSTSGVGKPAGRRKRTAARPTWTRFINPCTWTPGPSPTYNTAVSAGNVISQPHKSPVEDANAAGFGSFKSQPLAQQNVAGKGVWHDGFWNVVFIRDLKSKDADDVKFVAGKPVPVAFAIWNGEQHDRNGRKMVSNWYQLILDDGKASDRETLTDDSTSNAMNDNLSRRSFLQRSGLVGAGITAAQFLPLRFLQAQPARTTCSTRSRIIRTATGSSSIATNTPTTASSPGSARRTTRTIAASPRTSATASSSGWASNTTFTPTPISTANTRPPRGATAIAPRATRSTGFSTGRIG